MRNLREKRGKEKGKGNKTTMAEGRKRGQGKASKAY